MASMASISRRLCGLLLSNSNKPSARLSSRFCATLSSSETLDSDDSIPEAEADPEAYSSPSSSTSSSSYSTNHRPFARRTLQNGVDIGIYKAILVGQVGQSPLQKRLANGMTVTLLSVGTGGIRNNRRPFSNEDPKEYANRCAVQWHRVAIYPPTLGSIAMKHAVPGSILYLEGNLETKIFSDPITGLVRRIREIVINRRGRLVFLGKGNDSQLPSQGELKQVGYY